MNFKKRLISTAVFTAFAMATQCAFAADTSITLRVPFAFVVAGRTMPAGAYTIEASGSVVAVRGSGASVLVAGEPQSFVPYAEPGLIFSRHGGTSYLVGVRTEEETRSIGSGLK